MPALPKEIVDQVMKLPARVRARLAKQLIASLDQEPVDADVETLWIVEAQRRAEELAAQKVEEIPAEQALAKARAVIR